MRVLFYMIFLLFSIDAIVSCCLERHTFKTIIVVRNESPLSSRWLKIPFNERCGNGLYNEHVNFLPDSYLQREREHSLCKVIRIFLRKVVSGQGEQSPFIRACEKAVMKP